MSKGDSLKYYFTGSTKNIDKDKSRYKVIIDYLNKAGYQPQNYVHFPKNNLLRKKYEKEITEKEVSVYDRQTSLISKSDMLIADITEESVTVGYQIEYAIGKKIPVLVLLGPRNNYRTPVMLTSDHFGLLTVKKYKTLKEVKKILDEFTKSVTTGKIKFNFFLNIPLHNYITKRSVKENKTKSEIIREILQKELEKKPL